MSTQYHEVYMHDIVEKWRLVLVDNLELEKSVTVNLIKANFSIITMLAD